MPALLRKLALIAVLVVMPLQGLASAIAPFNCAAMGMEHGAASSGHAHGDSGAAGHHDHDHGTGAGDFSQHFDCHPVFSGTPVTYPTATLSGPPVLLGTVSLMATLFIPESPQRPPKS